MRKVVFSISTLAVVLVALSLWLVRPTPSLATSTPTSRPQASKPQPTLTPILTSPKTALAPATSDQPNPSISAPAVSCDPVWTQVASPTTSHLHAVAAVTAYDAWAVGDGGFIRWNGTSWNAVVVPTPTSFSSFALRAVSSRQANDVWAAGSYSDGTNSHTIVYHWDGTTWNLVSSPTMPDQYLEGIIPISAGTAIAVGRNGTGGAPMIYRCTTSSCTFQSQPIGSGGLLAVDALSSNNIWATGVISASSLILHYDGTTWSQINTVDVGPLNGVVAIAPSDVWAVGSGGSVHWNGTSWTQQDTFPNIAAISGISTNDIWSVGSSVSGDNIRHYTNAWAGYTSTGTALNGVSARAANDVWAVGDAGYITRFAPPQQFDDVQLGSTFYSFVQDLSCRAIISGYPCGGPNEPCTAPNNLPYFRPTANVTRGQLSKIIILAANIPTPAQTQTFEDVPVGSTFHPYVEALAFQNAIGGYPCGGPNEPCGSDNKPYFRPNNTSTRAQTAKIVAITAGYTDPFQTQTFEDIPTNSTFYTWIENLASRSIINGYPCGTPGEPCVAPTNRPYFRPANNVTRGQMSKIAVITFTP